VLYKIFAEKEEGALVCSLLAMKVENWRKLQLIKKQILFH
jgi:hypothetical protein